MTDQDKYTGKEKDIASSLWTHKTRLSNGSEFYGLQTSSPGLTKVIIRFEHPWLFAAGNTLADFMFRLLKSGTKDKDTLTFVSKVEETGMMLSNNVTPDSGLIEFVVLDDQAGSAFPLIFEMIYSPRFPEDEFERVRNLGYENWRISRRQTHVLARERFMQSVFINSPYGQIATGDEIRGFTIENVIKIHTQITQSIRPVIFAASSDPEKTAKALETALLQHLPASVNNDSRPVLDEYWHVTPPVNGNSSHISMPDTVQSSIRTGREMFTRDHPEYIVARVATTLLGGYFSSRLMANLREDKGYTYGVGANLATLASAGYLTISADVGSEHLHNAVGEIVKEMDRLRNEPVEEDELQTVKQYLRGSALRDTDGAFNRLDLYAVLMRRRLEPEWIDSFIAGLELVTPADIMSFARKWLKFDEFVTITCGKTSSEAMNFKNQYNIQTL